MLKMVPNATEVDSSSLLVDEAAVTVSGHIPPLADFWAQSVDCFLCDLIRLPKNRSIKETVYIFDVNTKWNWEIRNTHNNTPLAQLNNVIFGEHGVYNWNIINASSSVLKNVDPPHNKYFPLIYTLVCVLLTGIICKYRKHIRPDHLYRRLSRQNENVVDEIESDLGAPIEVREILRSNSGTSMPRGRRSNRLKSLDVFRGITILLMIFVNYGGGHYSIFEHAPWNGVTIADFVFPWFVWIMGVGIALKVKAELRNSIKRSIIFRNICIRSLTLIGLGIVLGNLQHDDLKDVRIPGVLQRLGASYFLAASIEAYFMQPQTSVQPSRLQFLEDLMESWRQWLTVICLVGVHTAITFFLPVPNCPAGYLGPGGLHDHSAYFNCTGGAAGYVDRLLFTQSHIYQRPTCQQLYKCVVPYDPEGLLGILTSTLCTYLGVHAGRIIQVYSSSMQRMKRWLSWFFVTAVLSGVLCSFSKEDGVIPLNKNLWSLSYVLLCSSLGYILITVFYFLVDKGRWWSGSPFYQPGMNSIALYVGHIVARDTLPWQWKPFFISSHWEYVIMDTWAVFLWLCVSLFLYKRKIFITV